MDPDPVEAAHHRLLRKTLTEGLGIRQSRPRRQTYEQIAAALTDPATATRVSAVLDAPARAWIQATRRWEYDTRAQLTRQGGTTLTEALSEHVRVTLDRLRTVLATGSVARISDALEELAESIRTHPDHRSNTWLATHVDALAEIDTPEFLAWRQIHQGLGAVTAVPRPTTAYPHPAQVADQHHTPPAANSTTAEDASTSSTAKRSSTRSTRRTTPEPPPPSTRRAR